MALKPKIPQNSGNGGGTFENTSNLPTPRAGLRKARVSLIVDMGEQEREDFEDPKTKVKTPRDPAQQLAVFVDLVNDVVDYGGKIGMQQYRLPVNSVFKGEFKGINFSAVPQKDADGNILKDKDGKWLPFVLHPVSPLTKIAKASGRDDVIKSMDVEQLLDAPLMVDVEVKVTPHKEGKLDKDGKPIVYKNVNYKGPAKVPEDDDGKPGEVKPLTAKPLCITFDNATKEMVQFIRPGLRKQIKLALDYAGSNMQKAIEAWEAENPISEAQKPAGDDSEAETPAPAPAARKRTPAPPPKPATGFDDMDDDIPF